MTQAFSQPVTAPGLPAVGLVCADSPAQQGPGRWRQVLTRMIHTSFIYGPVLTWWRWAPCASWPAQSADRYTGPWNASTQNPILVIGTRFDPNTAYVNARRVERDWKWIAPHALHVLDSYSRWTSEAYGKPMGPYAGGVTAETLRESAAYRVLTPEQAIALAQELGDYSSLYLTPLLGGIEPTRAWKMLRLFERDVHPHLPRGRVPRWGMTT